MASPKPISITGGCLCGALKYRVDFPENHDFSHDTGTCQCTQCRRQTSSLFFHFIQVPLSALTWISPTTSTLKYHELSPGNLRGWCGACGTFMTWRSTKGNTIDLTVGTIDPLFLFGEGADGSTIPKGGYGRMLLGGGRHHWCRNEVPGVTDADGIRKLLGHQGGLRGMEDELSDVMARSKAKL